MHPKQMAASLEIIAPLANFEAGEQIIGLAKVLCSVESKSVAALATKLTKGLDAKGYAPAPNAASLLVQRMTDVAIAAGASTLAKEFAAAARILETLGTAEPSQIATVVADALAPPAKKTSQKSRVSKAPPVDPHEMADDLTGAISDNAKFDSLVETLGDLPPATVRAVAQYFLGSTRSFGKKEAISAIQARQRQDALDATRDRSISKIAV